SDERRGRETRAEHEALGAPRSTLDEWQSVWPEKGPARRLAAPPREIGAAALARAFHPLCRPDQGVPIKAEWVQFWCDPVGQAASLSGTRTDLRQAGSLPYEQIILSIDPAVSQKSDTDLTALVTLGKTESNEIHCLEAIARRVSTPELVNLIDAADRRWQQDVILFETNAAFAGIKDLLMRHGSFGGKIEPVVQTRDQMSRAHAFSVPVENGSFRLRGLDPTHVHQSQQGLFDEMTSFPFG